MVIGENIVGHLTNDYFIFLTKLRDIFSHVSIIATLDQLAMLRFVFFYINNAHQQVKYICNAKKSQSHLTLANKINYINSDLCIILQSCY